jgi:hypothetical protein
MCMMCVSNSPYRPTITLRTDIMAEGTTKDQMFTFNVTAGSFIGPSS